MKIFLFSYNKSLIRLISDKLEEKGHSCVQYSDIDLYLNAIIKPGESPELLVMDYTSWNHEIFPFLSYLRDFKLFRPFIFFNDPCPVLGNRVKLWLYLLKYDLECFPLERRKKNPEDLEIKYKPVFKQIADIVESKALRPYIPLMQKPLPLPDSLPMKNAFEHLNRIELNKESIYEFKKKVKLPNSLFFMLEMFSRYMDIVVTKEHIINYYNENSKHISEESIKVKISNLRKYFSKDKNCKYNLFPKDGGYIFHITSF
ncbi:MAG: winged helix-turn-helix domain-containing protein [Treponema sp.]|nr:winged helix-turn-helix domain-containing protein [Treponema sp.]